MKIVVIGGIGLIGTKLVAALRTYGHDVTSASRPSGVNTVTGEGLAAAMHGADVVVDVSNSQSLDEQVALAFFLSSGRNLLAAGKAAGVRHHVALSAVGTDRLPESGYFRAKMAQEDLVRASGIPYTILRSTPFFEFINGIVEADARGNALRVAPAHLQPIAADDAVAALLDVALDVPQQRELELAGPEAFRLDKLAGQILAANEDTRVIIADGTARYFGAILADDTLMPGRNALLAPTRFEDWLRLSIAGALAPAF